MITSTSNPRVKLLRSLHERRHRRAHGLCLVEGVRLVEEALTSELQVDTILYAPERLSASAAGRSLRPRLERLSSAEQIADSVLAALTDTVTSQGVIAAVTTGPPRPLPAAGHLLVLDGIADPGNAGTMLRTARAAGAAGVLAIRSTTDLWAPKVVRAGMGAHFHVLIMTDVMWHELPSIISGRQLLLATARNGAPYWEVDWSQPSAVVIGSEAHGLSESAGHFAGRPVSIPMAEGTESLNAAAAAAVLLFAAREATIKSAHDD